MPIQFRCGSCNQLLGIATRKAGHVVNCPTCGDKTVVPRPLGSGLKAPSPVPALAQAEGMPGIAAAPALASAAEAEEPDGVSILDRVDVAALLAPPKEGHPVTVSAPPESEPAPDAPAAPNRRRQRDLEMTALPGSGELLSLADIDDVSGPHFTLVLTPGRLAVLVALGIALLAGVLLLGMWLGSRFAA